jgi:hypothetical protein
VGDRDSSLTDRDRKWGTEIVPWLTEIGRGVGDRESSLTNRDSLRGTETVP